MTTMLPSNFVRIQREPASSCVDFDVVDKFIKANTDVKILCRESLSTDQVQLKTFRASGLLLSMTSSIFRRLLTERLDSTFREETDVALVLPDVTSVVLENVLSLMKNDKPQQNLDPDQLAEANQFCKDFQLSDYIAKGLRMPPSVPLTNKLEESVKIEIEDQDFGNTMDCDAVKIEIEEPNLEDMMECETEDYMKELAPLKDTAQDHESIMNDGISGPESVWGCQPALIDHTYVAKPPHGNLQDPSTSSETALEGRRIEVMSEVEVPKISNVRPPKPFLPQEKDLGGKVEGKVKAREAIKEIYLEASVKPWVKVNMSQIKVKNLGKYKKANRQLNVEVAAKFVQTLFMVKCPLCLDKLKCLTNPDFTGPNTPAGVLGTHLTSEVHKYDTSQADYFLSIRTPVLEKGVIQMKIKDQEDPLSQVPDPIQEENEGSVDTIRAEETVKEDGAEMRDKDQDLTLHNYMVQCPLCPLKLQCLSTSDLAGISTPTGALWKHLTSCVHRHTYSQAKHFLSVRAPVLDNVNGVFQMKIKDQDQLALDPRTGTFQAEQEHSVDAGETGMFLNPETGMMGWEADRDVQKSCPEYVNISKHQSYLVQCPFCPVRLSCLRNSNKTWHSSPSDVLFKHFVSDDHKHKYVPSQANNILKTRTPVVEGRLVKMKVMEQNPVLNAKVQCHICAALLKCSSNFDLFGPKSAAEVLKTHLISDIHKYTESQADDDLHIRGPTMETIGKINGHERIVKMIIKEENSHLTELVECEFCSSQFRCSGSGSGSGNPKEILKTHLTSAAHNFADIYANNFMKNRAPVKENGVFRMKIEDQDPIMKYPGSIQYKPNKSVDVKQVEESVARRNAERMVKKKRVNLQLKEGQKKIKESLKSPHLTEVVKCKLCSLHLRCSSDPRGSSSPAEVLMTHLTSPVHNFSKVNANNFLKIQPPVRENGLGVFQMKLKRYRKDKDPLA